MPPAIFVPNDNSGFSSAKSFCFCLNSSLNFLYSSPPILPVVANVLNPASISSAYSNKAPPANDLAVSAVLLYFGSF